MSDRTVLTDRGYQPYRGPRLGTSRAVRTIIRDGIRRILGLRRKARRKVLPWLMIGMMMLTMCVFLIIAWIQGIADFIDLFDDLYTGFLGAVALYGLILTSYAAPELLVPDRRSGMLNIYFSRPLRVGHYLLAKAGALAAVILGFWIIPLFIYHLGLAFLSDAGFASYLGGNLHALWRIPAAAACYLMYGSVALVCTALLKRVGAATGACIAVFFAFNIAVNITINFSETTTRWLSLLAFEQHVTNLRDWIFGQEGTDLMQQIGFGPWVSALVMLVVAAVSGFLVKLTYRNPV